MHNNNTFSDEERFIQFLRERVQQTEMHQRILSATRPEGLNFTPQQIRDWRGRCRRDGSRLPIVFIMTDSSGGQRYQYGGTDLIIRYMERHFRDGQGVQNGGIRVAAREATALEMPEILVPELPGFENLLYFLLNQNSTNIPRALVFGGVDDNGVAIEGILSLLLPDTVSINPTNEQDGIDAMEPIVVELTPDGDINLAISASYDQWSIRDDQKKFKGNFKIKIEYSFRIDGNRLLLIGTRFGYQGDIPTQAENEAKERKRVLHSELTQRLMPKMKAKKNELAIKVGQFKKDKGTKNWSRRNVKRLISLIEEARNFLFELEMSGYTPDGEELSQFGVIVIEQLMSLLEEYRYNNRQYLDRHPATEKVELDSDEARGVYGALVELKNELVRKHKNEVRRMVAFTSQEVVDDELMRLEQLLTYLGQKRLEVSSRGDLWTRSNQLGHDADRELTSNLFLGLELLIESAEMQVREKMIETRAAKLRKSSITGEDDLDTPRFSEFTDDTATLSRAGSISRRHQRYRSEGHINRISEPPVHVEASRLGRVFLGVGSGILHRVQSAFLSVISPQSSQSTLSERELDSLDSQPVSLDTAIARRELRREWTMKDYEEGARLRRYYSNSGLSSTPGPFVSGLQPLTLGPPVIVVRQPTTESVHERSQSYGFESSEAVMTNRHQPLRRVSALASVRQTSENSLSERSHPPLRRVQHSEGNIRTVIAGDHSRRDTSQSWDGNALVPLPLNEANVLRMNVNELSGLLEHHLDGVNDEWLYHVISTAVGYSFGANINSFIGEIVRRWPLNRQVAPVPIRLTMAVSGEAQRSLSLHEVINIIQTEYGSHALASVLLEMLGVGLLNRIKAISAQPATQV